MRRVLHRVLHQRQSLLPIQHHLHPRRQLAVRRYPPPWHHLHRQALCPQERPQLLQLWNHRQHRPTSRQRRRHSRRQPARHQLRLQVQPRPQPLSRLRHRHPSPLQRRLHHLQCPHQVHRAPHPLQSQLSTQHPHRQVSQRNNPLPAHHGNPRQHHQECRQRFRRELLLLIQQPFPRPRPQHNRLKHRRRLRSRRLLRDPPQHLQLFHQVSPHAFRQPHRRSRHLQRRRQGLRSIQLRLHPQHLHPLPQVLLLPVRPLSHQARFRVLSHQEYLQQAPHPALRLAVVEWLTTSSVPFLLFRR
mmetsp:Transcript_24807/g.74588  ORF Transcript_24807/g.74588 Transcript_24807/m.74588 type:complete len:301 (+) Transcript_24807:3966-4868(+)